MKAYHDGPTPKRLLPDEDAEVIGPFLLVQKKKGVRLTQDPLLLCDFLLPLNENDRVMDIGAGTGIIPLVLAWKSGARVTGVEVEPVAASLARRNVGENGLSDRVEIIEGDYRGLAERFPEGAFSVVVSNPPYVKAGSGRVSPMDERALARAEVKGRLTDLLSVSKHLAGREGRICFVFRTERLFEMLEEAKRAGLSARRIRFIHTSRKKAAKLFLIEFGSKGELRIEEPVFI